MKTYVHPKLALIGLILSVLAACDPQSRSAPAPMADRDHKAALAKAQLLDSYVQSLNMNHYGRISYWPNDNPICIHVIGQPGELADYIKARIRYDAQVAELEIDKATCRDVNLQIDFSEDFDRTIKGLASYKPEVFGYKNNAAMDRDLATIKGPFHVWYKKYDDDDAMIASVLVIIDKAQTRNFSPVALADYLAFVSLAQVKADTYRPLAPTILNLIANQSAAGPTQGELSDWDRAYLKSIYGVGMGPSDNITNYRVASRMRYLLLRTS